VPAFWRPRCGTNGWFASGGADVYHPRRGAHVLHARCGADVWHARLDARLWRARPGTHLWHPRHGLDVWVRDLQGCWLAGARAAGVPVSRHRPVWAWRPTGGSAAGSGWRRELRTAVQPPLTPSGDAPTVWGGAGAARVRGGSCWWERRRRRRPCTGLRLPSCRSSPPHASLMAAARARGQSWRQPPKWAPSRRGGRPRWARRCQLQSAAPQAWRRLAARDGQRGEGGGGGKGKGGAERGGDGGGRGRGARARARG